MKFTKLVYIQFIPKTFSLTNKQHQHHCFMLTEWIKLKSVKIQQCGISLLIDVKLCDSTVLYSVYFVIYWWTQIQAWFPWLICKLLENPWAPYHEEQYKVDRLLVIQVHICGSFTLSLDQSDNDWMDRPA